MSSVTGLSHCVLNQWGIAAFPFITSTGGNIIKERGNISCALIQTKSAV